MKLKYFFLLFKQALSQYFLLVIAIATLPLLMYFGTGSVELKCQKTIKKDTICQLKHAHLYGLVKDQSTPFYLFSLETRPVASCARIEDDEAPKCDDYNIWLETSMGTFSLRKLRYSSLEEAEVKAIAIRQYIVAGVEDFYIIDNLDILNDIVMTFLIGGTLLVFGYLVSRNSS